MSRASALRSAILRGLALATLVACGGGSGGDTTAPDNTPASITISPSTPLTLVSGATISLTSTVHAADGHVVANASIGYSSSDETIASVAGGVVTAGKAGTATITATSGSVSAPVTVIVTPGAPTHLGLQVQPAGTTVGATLATQPVIEIRDNAGNLVTTAQSSVTASITAGGGTLTGTTTIATSGGVATFTNLAITGIAGTRSLSFASPGLASVSSADVALAAPPTPLLVLETTAVSLSAISGASQTLSLAVRDGGTAPLVGVTADAPVHDPGQPTGWLVATITGSAAPFSLRLQVTAPLAPGTYRAVVKVNATGATNSPVSVVVTLVVSSGTFITLGNATEKLRILDIGDSYTPTLSAKDGAGQPTSPGTVTYVSRATSVATVDAQGRITARGEGQTYVTAVGVGNADSVFVSVTRATNGPVLRSDLTTYAVKAGDVTFINIYLDTRSTPVGAVTVAIGYTTAVSVFSSVTITIPTGPPVPVVSTQTSGVYRVSVASATALTGQIALLRLRVVTPTSNTSGAITLTVTDIVAPDGTDLLPVTTSTRIPIIVQ